MKRVNVRLIVIPKKDLRMVVEILYLGAGWRNDPPDRQGLSHFLEHIIASDDVERIMKIRYHGGERIAQTVADFIRIVHYVPEFVWKENLTFLLDYLYRTEIKESKVNSQKEFLAKEIRHWNSYPHTHIIRKLLHLLFYPHPYSNNGVGKVEDIYKVTLSLLEHYRRCFWGDIMIVVAGNVKEDEVKDIVNKYFEKRKVETEIWKTRQFSFPKDDRAMEEIENEGRRKYIALGGIIKEPDMEDIVSLYILSFLLTINDPDIKRILNNVGVPAILTKSQTASVFFNDASAFFGVVLLESEIKSADFSSIWYAISKEFSFLKEKVLIYHEIQDVWSEMVLAGSLYFTNRNYQEFMDKLNSIDKKTFLNVYEKLDREVTILTRRKT